MIRFELDNIEYIWRYIDKEILENTYIENRLEYKFEKIDFEMFFQIIYESKIDQKIFHFFVKNLNFFIKNMMKWYIIFISIIK